MPTRLLLGETDTLLTDLWGAHLIQTLPGTIITTARTVRELERASIGDYDLAIVDLHLEDGDVFEWIKDRTARRQGRILVLTACALEVPIYRLLQLGITTIFHKADGLRLLEDAVGMAIAGGSALSPRISEVADRIRADPNSFCRILSDREQELLALFGAGRTSREVATRLRIAETTVAYHRKNILLKLGLKGQAQFIAYALAKGFFPMAGRLPQRRASTK